MPLTTILSFTGSTGLVTSNASKSGGTWASALNGYANDYVYDTSLGGAFYAQLYIGGLEQYAASINDVDVRCSGLRGSTHARDIQYRAERGGTTTTGANKALTNILAWYSWGNIGCPGVGGWLASYLMNWDTVRFGGGISSNSSATAVARLDCVEVTANWYPFSGGFLWKLRSILPPVLLGAHLLTSDWTGIWRALRAAGQTRLTKADMEAMEREYRAWTRPKRVFIHRPGLILPCPDPISPPISCQNWPIPDHLNRARRGCFEGSCPPLS